MIDETPAPATRRCDVLVVGGGPAGLAAALILGRALREVIVVDKGERRNRRSRAIGGVIGFDGAPPEALVDKARGELGRYETVRWVDGEVVAAEAFDGGFRARLTDGTTIAARRLLLATGVVDTLPEIEGAEACYGKSLWHCPYCDGYEQRGAKVAVIGRGPPASGLALELTGWTRDLVVLTDGRARLGAQGRAKLAANDIALREDPIARIQHHDGVAERVHFRDGGSVAVDALFFPSVGRNRTDLAASLGCRTARNGCVRSIGYGRTHARGVYVAGDASHHVQLVAVAAGEGAAAAFAINGELIKEGLR